MVQFKIFDILMRERQVEELLARCRRLQGSDKGVCMAKKYVVLAIGYVRRQELIPYLDRAKAMNELVCIATNLSQMEAKQ